MAVVKPQEGSRRRKPAFTQRISSSTDSDSQDSLPDPFYNSPSTSRTPIDKSKSDVRRMTPNGVTPQRKGIPQVTSVRDQQPLAEGSGNGRAIQALTGLKDGFVFRLADKEDTSKGEDEPMFPKELLKMDASFDESMDDEDIPEGTVVIQPEAAPDGEEDWIRSKEFKKHFHQERRERREAQPQNSNSASADSVFCTACTEQVNPFDKKTIFSHPVLSVVICRRCMEFYNSGPWKLDADGIEEQCRWCGEGGKLTCCDNCPRTFCKPCIVRNLGRKEWSRIQSQKEWWCYVCKPLPLKELVTKCSALLSKFDKSKRLIIVKSEKEKINGNGNGKKNKAITTVDKDSVQTSKEKKARTLSKQDSAIAEEFLQYLVGNISSKPLYMRSLVRLKKEVPSMRKPQMNVALKHLAEVKEVLAEYEASIKRHLHGDLNKSDSALDGTDPEDFESPERRDKVSSAAPYSKTESVKKEQIETSPKQTKTETLTKEQDKETQSCTAQSTFGQSSSAATENCANIDADIPDHICENDLAGDSEGERMEIDNGAQVEEVDETSKEDKFEEEDEAGEIDHMASQGKDQIAEEPAPVKETDDKCASKLKESLLLSDLATDETMFISDLADDGDLAVSKEDNDLAVSKDNADAADNTVDSAAKDTSGRATLHGGALSPRKMKVTVRLRRFKADDAEAKLMSMIDNSDSESADEDEGSDYDPRSSKNKSKSPKGKNKVTPSKGNKASRPVKQEPESGPESDLEDALVQKQGPGEDSSNAEGESGFDGIPGNSSAEVSHEEAVDDEKRGQTKGASASGEAKESDGIFNLGSPKKKRSVRRKKRKNLRERKVKEKSSNPIDSSDSESDDERDLKRLENISDLKRKRDDKEDDEEEDENVEESADEITSRGVKRDNENQDQAENAKKQRKEKNSPSKSEIKSKEFLSSTDSSDGSEDALLSDDDEDIRGLKWKSLNKSKKDEKEAEENVDDDAVAEKLLMGEIEEASGEEEDDEDDDDDDDDEEIDGAGTRRSKKTAQKRAAEEEEEMEEDEDWNNGASRDNDQGANANGKEDGDEEEDRNEDDADGDKDQNYEEEEEEDDEEENDEEEDDEEENEESDDEVGMVKKKSHPLLQVNISSHEEEDDEENEEEVGKNKKGKGKKTSKQTRKGKATKKKKVVYETDDYFTSSESDEVPSETVKGKKKRVTRSQTASSTEDSSVEKKKKPKKKKGKRAPSTSSDADSSKDTKPARRGKGGKGKKRRRIKEMKESDSEEESKTQDDEQENGSAGSEDEDGSPKKGRKHIRRVMKKSKLQAETVAAEVEEQERRKRIEQKRKEIINEEEEKAKESALVKRCILEKNKETNDVVLEVDERIVKHLKPHQVEGITFLFDSTFETIDKADEHGGGCILAHCMGLGKTLQVITYLHTLMTNEKLGIKTCLVVAPLNTVLNWQDEFEKWIGHLDSGIEVYEMSNVKNNDARADLLNHWLKHGGVMIMGYSMYRNLSLLTHVRKKKLKEIFLRTLVDPGPNIVVCDEGHMLKNEASAISKAMNNIKTLRRVCLTGTPLQNNLIEYHCMVHFVKPNLLGTIREFKNRFVNPITNGQHQDSTPRDVKVMKRRAHVLHNLLSGCVQRKDYSALTKFLPPKHEYVVSVRLSPIQIALYELYLNKLSARKEEGKVQPTTLFADYQVLMNVWNHPHLLQLAAQREDRQAARKEFDDFITSEEEVEDDNDSIKEFVISSDSDLEDPWKSTTSKKDVKIESGSSRGSRASSRNKAGGSMSNSDDDNDNGGGGGDNSDSSMEVVKSWNTRSRAKESGLSEGASTSAADFFIPEPPPRAKEWYSEHLGEEAAQNIELSGKVVLMFEILRMAESVGEKVLVFSQSLLVLDMLENVLANLEEKAMEERANGEQDLENQIGGYGQWTKGEDYFRMDGSTPAHLRKRWSEIFNDKENIRARLFLISTKAGSLGINLVAANRVIIFDANWNPSHDIQSIFRVYRFGQERAVFVYRLIAQGTMEEKIYDRQVTKQSLSQRVVDEHQIERHFTSADLNELYNFTPDRLDDPDRPKRPTPVLPKDYFLAELLKNKSECIVTYHEHDSLLENLQEEELTEDERKEAWKDYDDEKKGINRLAMMRNYDPQEMQRIYQEGESILRMGEMMLNYPGQPGLPNMQQGGAGVPGTANQQMQRMLEMQTYYRVQMQQQQRQRQIEREQQQLQQRYLMLQQTGQLPNSSAGAPASQPQAGGSAGNSQLRQLQQIAQIKQHAEMVQQQQRQLLQQQQQQLQQRGPGTSSSNASANMTAGLLRMIAQSQAANKK